MAPKSMFRPVRWLALVTLVTSPLGLVPVALAQAPPGVPALKAQSARAAHFDISRPLRELGGRTGSAVDPLLIAPDLGPIPPPRPFAGDRAVQSRRPGSNGSLEPDLTFEGLSNEDNQRLVSPPDPAGDVGPDHYVEMVNIAIAVYSKTGERLLGPIPIGALWEGFEIPDCSDLSGDPIVRHDQLADRWILTQFSTRGPIFYNCLAVSVSADPTGAYYRYAFSTGINFPDYPKYGVWDNAYFISAREFRRPENVFVGIGAYALEREAMLRGDPDARVVSFLVPPGTTPWLLGDGLLPSDLDGQRPPPAGTPNFFVGTMNQGVRGAPFDAINIFEFAVDWSDPSSASFSLAEQLAVDGFDSLFPCTPDSRSCIDQPDTARKIDILSYRQRPTWRLAYRNFGEFETLVTNQSVQAMPGVAGVRWYEIRRVDGKFSVYQQGTFAADDGVHRWMGSIAMDRLGNLALGYSVSSGTNVYPGIRYSGRLSSDSLGEMTLGEGVIVNGSGSQTASSRWGDYTSMNVDPTDDCSFWYVNEYYEVTSERGWQTRIGRFRLPGC